ncbi:uncharacterized protein CIMG_11240 [Coccidioides immitis RS]|uniref:Uncharacterized protein n=1 Tax=Coccidioides immitis (strain RS) TaxID=246410 RepID=A0A0D8JZ96_COCIM|nr:uncharacterized protein CIMG_11240 [Coccidioides immitis RS]KJF61588.1 hypothetical protein CIMG_11240 [Coccidioides immitis RS]
MAKASVLPRSAHPNSALQNSPRQPCIARTSHARSNCGEGSSAGVLEPHLRQSGTYMGVSEILFFLLPAVTRILFETYGPTEENLAATRRTNHGIANGKFAASHPPRENLPANY